MLAIEVAGCLIGALAYVAAASRVHHHAYMRYVQREGHDEARAIAHMLAVAWPLSVATLVLWESARLLVRATRPVRFLVTAPLSWAWRLGAPKRPQLPEATAKIKRASVCATEDAIRTLDAEARRG